MYRTNGFSGRRKIKILLIILLILVGLRYSSYIFGLIGFGILLFLEYWFISIPVIILVFLINYIFNENRLNNS